MKQISNIPIRMTYKDAFMRNNIIKTASTQFTFAPDAQLEINRDVAWGAFGGGAGGSVTGGLGGLVAGGIAGNKLVNWIAERRKRKASVLSRILGSAVGAGLGGVGGLALGRIIGGSFGGFRARQVSEAYWKSLLQGLRRQGIS